MRGMIMVALLGMVAGCSPSLTAKQAECFFDAERVAAEKAEAMCETEWNSCEHAQSLRDGLREDYESCLEVK